MKPKKSAANFWISVFGRPSGTPVTSHASVNVPWVVLDDFGAQGALGWFLSTFFQHYRGFPIDFPSDSLIRAYKGFCQNSEMSHQLGTYNGALHHLVAHFRARKSKDNIIMRTSDRGIFDPGPAGVGVGVSRSSVGAKIWI